ncbi:hypothetical protein PTTG_28167 [Puccinia triticina 1-1 BBBD Race 1]|uniref:Uncharacterized protein n=1 Tax=Puccinia triticina (isolate 1-1 / race 1 (BBBD)) TaxID=630390 RepID=A0A180GEY5_PUCT1|nr:hypothetical protein PTTG_28167 [Puccinia triticina 1-1 BBBD Race 1]
MSNSRQSTPPNQATNQRQSSRVRTPLERPGFIQTHDDSRRSLAPKSPTTNPSPSSKVSTKPHKKRETAPILVNETRSDDITTSNQADKEKSCKKRGHPNIQQDSDEENAKAVKKVKVVKGGFDNPKLYYFPGTKAADQENGLTYRCRWCPKSVQVPLSTISNLKTHCDGSINETGFRKACLGRSKAIAEGGNFPPSAEEMMTENKKKEGASGTLVNFVQKGRFDNKTFNKLLVFWLIRHSLPWARFGDYSLGVTFDYSNATTHVFSETWAALEARRLYIDLQKQVISQIHVSSNQVRYLKAVSMLTSRSPSVARWIED